MAAVCFGGVDANRNLDLVAPRLCRETVIVHISCRLLAYRYCETNPTYDYVILYTLVVIR